MVLVLGIGLIVALSALMAPIFQMLWNGLAPLFWEAAPILTFWQALGTMMLLNIIEIFFRASNK